jgi:hypothetical protein
MAVNIIIAVAGQGSGSGGESRSFPYSLIMSDPTPLVTLSLSDTTGVTSYFWELLNQPPFATAVLSSQSASNPTFTPTATRWGTYLIRCTITRNGVQEIDEIGLSFRTPNQDLRFPAAGEKVEFDTDDGWALAEFYFWQYVDNLSLGGGGGGSYWERVSTILSPATNGDTIQVGSGSVSSPSYSYESDIDTGRRLYNTGIEAFTVGGIDQLLFGNDSGPYIKAADNHQYLKIGNYKTTSGGYSQVVIEGVGHANNSGGKATIQATAPTGKISELDLLSTNIGGSSTINVTSNSGSSISSPSIVAIRSEGQGPTSLTLVASASVNDVDSLISLSSTSLVGDSSITIGAHAPIGNSYIAIGNANTKQIRLSDKNLDDSSYPNAYWAISSIATNWDDLNSNYGTQTLVEILNTLHDSIALTISAGTGINAPLAGGVYTISVHDAPSTEIDFNVLSGHAPTDYALQTYLNFVQGPTKLSSADGLTSDGGSGTVNISALNGLVKSSNTENANTVFANWTSVTALSITDNDVSSIVANYATTPTITASTDLSGSFALNKILLSLVKRESTSIEYLNIDAQGSDLGYGINEKSIIKNNYKPEYGTGIIISGTGTRNLAITSGWMYWGLSKVASSVFDSSSSDTWSNFYTTDSGTTWTKVTSQTQIDNANYNNIASGLSALGASEYGLFWIYRNYSNTDVYVVYGIASYATLDAAKEVPAPSLVPWQVNEFSYLIGRVITQQGTDILDVTSIFIDEIAGGTVSAHNLLSLIQGGTSNQRYHLTETQHNDLTANMPLDPISVIFTDGSNQLATHANLKYSPGGTTGYLNFTIAGSSTAAGSIVSSAIDGSTSLGIVSTSVGTSGGASVISMESKGNDGTGSYGIYTNPQGEHRWEIDGEPLLYLNFVSSEHSRLTCKQKYLDIYNIHTTPTTDEDSTILITNTAYDTANITIENSATNPSGSVSTSIKSLLPDGAASIDILSDSSNTSGGSSVVTVKANGNSGSSTLQLDTDVYFKIDDVVVFKISDFIDPNDETELSIPGGTGDRTLYIRNLQTNGSAYTSIINKSIATDSGSTEAGLGFICESTEDSVDSYIQIAATTTGSNANADIDIVSQAGSGDGTRKSAVRFQYDNPNAVDSAVSILESTALADDSVYARFKTIAGDYGLDGGFIEIESTGKISIDSSSGNFTFGSLLTIDSPITRIESPKFVVGVNCTMNHGNYARAYGEYVSTVFEGASHFSLDRKDTNSGSVMGGNGLVLTVATSGNETAHFRYKLSDSQDDSYTPFKIPENRIICISGTVVSSCTGAHIDAIYVQKFNWVLWNSTYHADEPGEGALVVLDRASWLPTITIDPIATDGWFNLDVTVSGASVGDTVLHVCHITEFTVAETAYVASS